MSPSSRNPQILAQTRGRRESPLVPGSRTTSRTPRFCNESFRRMRVLEASQFRLKQTDHMSVLVAAASTELTRQLSDSIEEAPAHSVRLPPKLPPNRTTSIAGNRVRSRIDEGARGTRKVDRLLPCSLSPAPSHCQSISRRQGILMAAKNDSRPGVLELIA